MTLKKYLRPEEAARYLSGKTGQRVSTTDLRDLSLEGQIHAVIYYKGRMAIPELEEKDSNTEFEEKTARFKNYYFEGYFSNRNLGDFFEKEGFWTCPSPLDPWELLFSGYPYSGPDHETLLSLLSLWPIKGWDSEKDTLHQVTPSLRMEDILFIPRAELDALIAKHQADSTPSPAPVAAAEPAPQQTEALPEALSAKASALPAELAAVLDTTHPDHAPDLAEAIRLWLALYGGETTKHSHSNACGHWMKAQGISDSFIDSTAGRRIKEITSPQRAWDAQRKERHASRKKQD